jgi:hypothetical protein
MKTYHLPTRSPGRGKLQLLVMALIGAAVLSGCSQFRKATYPGDFVYLEEKQITNEMIMLSIYMRQIDQILLEQSTISSEQQAKLVQLLSSIEVSVEKLGAGSVETNHLLIDDRIDKFKSDVNIALRDTSADPPNYYSLGRLYGSCVACHQYR